MNPVLAWGHCPHHGRVLAGCFGRCTRCEPVRSTVPQPTAPRRPARRPLGRPRPTTLTEREKAVALLIGKGLMYREVAAQLGVKSCSVSNMVKRACERVGAADTWELVRFVRRGM